MTTTNPTPPPVDECPHCERKPPRHHPLCPTVVNPPKGYQAPKQAATAAQKPGQQVDVVERVKAMQVAHRMSHENFCDSSYWKDEFDKEAEAAIRAMPPAAGQANAAQVERVRQMLVDYWASDVDPLTAAQSIVALCSPPTTSPADQPAVSLEKCFEAYINAGDDEWASGKDPLKRVRAILDAAGVAYVD